MRIDGHCHCGFLTYKAEVDPAKVFVCHCTDCQSISGSVFRWAAPVPAETFELLSGCPKTYVKIGDSGRESHQSFCPECASPLYATGGDDDPKEYRLRLGTCRQRDALIPKTEVWHRSAQNWISIEGETRKVDTQ